MGGARGLEGTRSLASGAGTTVPLLRLVASTLCVLQSHQREGLGRPRGAAERGRSPKCRDVGEGAPSIGREDALPRRMPVI
jgi:hypothetical protein